MNKSRALLLYLALPIVAGSCVREGDILVWFKK